MKTVSPNIFTLAFRILLLPGTIWLVIYPFYRLLNNEYEGKPSGIIFMSFFFFILFLLVNILSLLGIFKINYIAETNEFTFRHLFKSRIISSDEITGYYLTTLKTRWKYYSGYILVLKDGSTIELTEYNTTPLKDFYTLIVKLEIPCKGYKNSWYPLKRRDLIR